jgi:hypothetical protein
VIEVGNSRLRLAAGWFSKKSVRLRNAKARDFSRAFCFARHCEERSDEAIKAAPQLDCFASLAMMGQPFQSALPSR